MAGGSGSRMDAGIPKQFLLLGGIPLLMHSMNSFHLAYPDISLTIALPAGQFSRWSQLCAEHNFVLTHQVVEGGKTRFHSVKNALSCLDGDGLVAVHDGARPLITASLIRNAFLTAEQLGNCIPVIPLNESLRRVSGNTDRLVSHAVDRLEYRVVQTPQVFHAATLQKAYEQEYRDSFTDDAMVAESFGETIHLIEGDPVNLKITHPSDLAAAANFFSLSTGTEETAPASPPAEHRPIARPAR